MKKLIILLFFVSILAAAKDKPPVQWQTGRLTDISSERGRRVTDRRDDHVYYTIDAGDIVYVAERGLSSRWDKPLRVTINKDVRFHIKDQSLYLEDEEGKEHKLTIEKQIAKQAG